MEFDPQDQEILRLLAKLKDVNDEYPEGLLVARRRSYLKRMTEISLGISGDPHARNSIKSTKTPPLSPSTSTLLETILIVVIVAEAGLAAYFYRDQLSEFFQTFTTASETEEVPAPSWDSPSPEIQGVIPTLPIRSTIPEKVVAITVTPTGTPVPGMVNNTPAINQLNSTTVPTENNGNNGHHYGQTPKPERTKDNNGNPSGQTPKPPKDDPKPTKDK